jgi:hypothetical protein
MENQLDSSPEPIMNPTTLADLQTLKTEGVDQTQTDHIDLAKIPADQTQPPKFVENQLLGNTYTVDGPAEIRWIEGNQKAVYPAPTTIQAKDLVHKKFKLKQSQAFGFILALLTEIKKQKRMLPILQAEALQFIDKGVLKELEHMGYIKSRLVPLSEGSRQVGGRCVLWLTDKGKALQQVMHARAVEIKKQQELAASETSGEEVLSAPMTSVLAPESSAPEATL